MRILGVDIGSTSIKAVEIDSTFGRFEVRDYYEHQIDPEVGRTEALKNFMQGLQKKPDRIAFSLPATHTTFRNLLLPTKDKKAIQAGVGFELEDELPFPLEDCIYDYAILSQSKLGTQLHVVSTLKRHLVAAIEKWKIAQCEPDLITSEGWAYRTLLNKMIPLEEQKDPILVLQMGNEKTNVYMQYEGNPVLIREIQWGGRDITQAISEKYQIPMDQAELAKRDHGFVVPRSRKGEVSKEQADFSEILLQPIDQLITEIRQVEFSGKVLTHKNIHQIYLAGGACLLPGIDQVIEESLGAPTKLIQSLSSIAGTGVNYSEHSDSVFLLAASLALGMVKMDRNLTINLRKNEFSRKSGESKLKYAEVKRPIYAAAAVAACFFLSLIVQSIVYRSKLKILDSQIERSIKSFFVTIQPTQLKNYLRAPVSLRQDVNKELLKQRNISSFLAPNPHSPLDFLRVISGAIGKDMIVDLTQFKVGTTPLNSYSPKNDQTASLTFVVPDKSMAESVSSVLSDKLSNYKMTPESLPPSGASGVGNQAVVNKKLVKMVVTGSPKDSAYGK